MLFLKKVGNAYRGRSIFMYKVTTIKGYFPSSQSLLCRMTILNSNVLKRKELIQQM